MVAMYWIGWAISMRYLLALLLVLSTLQGGNPVDYRKEMMNQDGRLTSLVVTINDDSRLFATVIIADFICQAASRYGIEAHTVIQRGLVADIVHYSAVGQVGNLIAFQATLEQSIQNYVKGK